MSATTHRAGGGRSRRRAVIASAALVAGLAAAAGLARGPRELPDPATVPVPGFTFVGWRTYTADNDVEGPRVHRVALYRCNAFAQAVGVAPEHWATDLGLAYLDTEFVRLPADGMPAQVELGSPDDEHARDYDEPLHPYTAAPYLIARVETSQRVYVGLGGSLAHTRFGGATLPTEGVSWDEASAFCERAGLRLPGEDEWELACRGGTRTPFFCGSTIDPTRANHDGTGPYRPDDPVGEYRAHTQPGGSFPANAYGVFDMHGNVWEWCDDRFAPYSPRRVARGGGWVSYGRYCRAAFRAWYPPTERSPIRGFRTARSLG